MKRYYCFLGSSDKYSFISYRKSWGKIPRREQHKILVWCEKTQKRNKRYFQSCLDRDELPF